MEAVMGVNIEIMGRLSEGAVMPTVEQLAEKHGYGFGHLNGSYVLQNGDAGGDDWIKLMYNPDRIGRGFEIFYDENKYTLSLSFPSTPTDVNMYFDMVEELCGVLNTDEFMCDGEKATLQYISYMKEGAIEASRNAIWNICNDVMEDFEEFRVIFCAFNPITIGKKERLEIDGNLDNLEDFLDAKQKWDVYYSSIRFYNHPNGKDAFAAIWVGDDVPVVLPTEKVVPWNIDFEVKEWFIRTPASGSLIPFDDFMRHVEKMADYDSKHIIVNLNEEQINDLLVEYNYSLDKDDYDECHYWGKFLDHVDNHADKVEKKNLATDKDNGANHLAVYLHYAAKKNLLSRDFTNRAGAAVVKQLKSGIEDAKKRVLEDGFIAKELYTRYFEPDFAAFTRRFYAFGGGGYPRTVDDVALAYFGEEKYNCKEFDDEAYLFTPFDQNYYAALSSVIEREWKKYKKLRGIK